MDDFNWDPDPVTQWGVVLFWFVLAMAFWCAPANAGTNADDRRAACEQWSYWAQVGGAQALRGKPAKIIVLERGHVLDMLEANQVLDVPGVALWEDEATPENIEAVSYGYKWVKAAKTDEIPASATAAWDMFYDVCLSRERT